MSEITEAETVEPTPGEGTPRGGRVLLHWAREIGLVLVIATGLSLLIKTFLVQAFVIPSPSMEPLLVKGDRVLVTKLAPGPLDLHRGDVIVFSDPDRWLGPPQHTSSGPVLDAVSAGLTFVGLLPDDADQHLIKRVIGLPGDRVVCCDAANRLTVNGTPVDEPYVNPGDLPSEPAFSVTVPPGRLWVMGDHRSVSQDSRFHQQEAGGGTISIDDVTGRAFARVWPLERFTRISGPSAFDQVHAP